MTPAARIAAAIEVIGAIEDRYRPVANALKDWGTAHRFAGSKDRAAIGNIVYDALRWRASNAWIMDADTPRALAIATVARRWGLGTERLAALFAGDPHAPEPLTVAETAALGAKDLAEAPPAVRADLPDWLAPRLQRSFGDGSVAEGEALALRPPLDMRANRLKAGRDKVVKALEKFGAATTPFSPDGVRIAATSGDGRHPNVQVEPAFQKGWFEVQDEGSQLAALLTGAKPGDQVLDLCAGAGGKTLALAAMTGNKGQIFATDSERARLAPIFDRLKRAGVRNVQVREAGADLADLNSRMGLVLVDAPCTGMGVWRRRPDAKWRLSEKALGERVAEQEALLDHAAAFVRPGGRLVYVTCSLIPDENEDQIARFLAARPRFLLADPAAGWHAATSTVARDGTFVGVGEGRAVRLTPLRHGTDGFFVAVMERRA